MGSLVRANCFKYSLYFIIRHNAGLAYSLPKLIKSIMIFRVVFFESKPQVRVSAVSARCFLIGFLFHMIIGFFEKKNLQWVMYQSVSCSVWILLYYNSLFEVQTLNKSQRLDILFLMWASFKDFSIGFFSILSIYYFCWTRVSVTYTRVFSISCIQGSIFEHMPVFLTQVFSVFSVSI